MNINFEKIKNLSPSKTAKLLNIQRDVVQKYKASRILPPLEKSVIMEDVYGIPARAWVDLKRYREKQGEK